MGSCELFAIFTTLKESDVNRIPVLFFSSSSFFCSEYLHKSLDVNFVQRYRVVFVGQCDEAITIIQFGFVHDPRGPHTGTIDATSDTLAAGQFGFGVREALIFPKHHFLFSVFGVYVVKVCRPPRGQGIIAWHGPLQPPAASYRVWREVFRVCACVSGKMLSRAFCAHFSTSHFLPPKGLKSSLVSPTVPRTLPTASK